MEFLPLPQVIENGEGFFHLRWDTPLVLGENTAPGALLYARMLREEIRRDTGLELRILRGEAVPACILLREDAALAPDHSTLRIDADGIDVAGGSDEALLHGVMTLRQWIRRHGAVLPALRVEDWPDLPHRGYYLDVSRGRIPTLASLKRTVDLLCEYKINEFQLYIEHTYLFRGLSEAWRDDDPLEAEDILELDAYCRERHIELVPSLATFGHMYQILSTRTCSALCERRDADQIPFSYSYAIRRHTINPTDPGSLALVKGMIAEYAALFTSRRFNICCDETFDLCCDRSREAGEREGAHTLYIRYLAELCRWLLERGLKPMFWGDILGQRPEAFQELPGDVICMNWGYEPDYPEDEIRNLARLGAVQYACPGVSTWSHLIPLLRDSFFNIRAMCRYAHRYGAVGLLNTDWGDWGHICDPAFSVPGMLYGAAFSWNRTEISLEEMNDAISFLYYGDRTGAFMRAFTGLTEKETFPWHRVIRWIEGEKSEREALLRETMGEIRQAPEVNQALEEAREALDRAAVFLTEHRRGDLQALQTAAEGVRLFNEIGMLLADRMETGKTLREKGTELAVRLEKWYHAYLQVWERTSRRGTLERTRRCMDALADLLRG